MILKYRMWATICIVIVTASLNFEDVYSQESSAVTENRYECDVQIEYLIKEVLGKSIKQLDHLTDCYTHRDSVMYDEGESWYALAYNRNDSLMFIAETNWLNKKIISRVTVLSPSIKTKYGVAVGQSYHEISQFVDENIPIEPDGIFSLQDRNDGRVFYMMNIEAYPELEYGLTDIKKLSPDIEIKSIVLMF